MVYGLYVLSPVTGSFATVACASYRRLNPSTARSGPHDFAVRLKRRSSCDTNASIASDPALMTLRNAPLSGKDAGRYHNFRFSERVFWPQDRKTQISLNSLMKLAFWRRRFGAAEGRTSEMNRCEWIKLICPDGANQLAGWAEPLGPAFGRPDDKLASACQNGG
jgi:hypothetical protein